MEQTKENQFETQAKVILKYLKNGFRYDSTFLPRPFFIEITGSPSAGKTTTITELDKFFRRMGFRVLRPQEGAEVIRHIGRDTPVYNARTGVYALTMLMDLSYGHQYDIVIFDRCIFDVYVWMMYWLEKGKLTPDEVSTIQTFFLMEFWAKNLDAAYFMICDPEEAMRRELRIALSTKLGETTNPATVATLIGRYKKAYSELASAHPNLFLIDTTKFREQEMVEYIAQHTLNILETHAKNARNDQQ